MQRPLSAVWSDEAENDLFEIWAYLAENASELVADRQLSNIERTVRHLCEFPRSGRSRDDLQRGIRSAAAEPYVVFHRVRTGTMEIVRVLHGRRDAEAIFSITESG